MLKRLLAVCTTVAVAAVGAPALTGSAQAATKVTVSGTVTDPSGDPVAGVRVYQSSNRSAKVTDSRGRFTIRTTSGPHVFYADFERTTSPTSPSSTVDAWAKKNANRTIGRYVATPNLAPVRVSLTIPRKGGRIHVPMQTGAVVEGRLTNPTGQPWPRDQLSLLVWSPRGNAYVAEAALSRDGRFRVPGLPPRATGERYALLGHFCSTRSGRTRCFDRNIDASFLAPAGRTTTLDVAFKVRNKGARTKVAGTPEVGRTLRADRFGFILPSASVTYRWLRDGRFIGGATDRHYTVKRKDAGHRIAVRFEIRSDPFLEPVSTRSRSTATIRR